MRAERDILTEISSLLLTIETDYPGLYRHLDEGAMSFSNSHQLHIGSKELKEYLQTLKAMLTHFKEEHNN